MSIASYPYGYAFEHVGASASNQVLGGTGAKGDYLHRLVISVSTAATSLVQITDGSTSAHTVMPNSVGGGIGCYSIELNMASQDGPWKITTGAGVEVEAVGIFTA